jgi:50S ribosomal subunit-associated GTPase HflX
VVVLNKIDLLLEPPAFPIDDPRVLRVLALSCVTGAGVEELKRALFELIPPAPEPAPVEAGAEELAEFLVYRPSAASRAYRILRTDRGFRVTGRAPDGEELERALRAAGARKGHEIEVGDETLVFE